MTHTAIHKLVPCALLWLCFSLLTNSSAISEIEIPVLPSDENEAIGLIEEGTLDSTVWRKIEPFYTMPVRVPQGELRILQDLFPELPSDMPCTPDELSRYQPWDEGAIKRFLADFPEIEPFMPILSFEKGPSVPFPGQAGFYFSRRGASDTARQYAMFSIGNQERIAASGRIDFTDAYGRWFRRTVSAAPLSGVRIACGNFSPRRRTALVSGYFPSNGDTDTVLSNNWLFGTGRTWNGASVSFSRTPDKQESRAVDAEVNAEVNAEAFFHARPTEQIGQFSGNVILSRHISCFGGVSYLRAMDPDNPARDFGYFHAGLCVSPARFWKCEMTSGVNFENLSALPWQVSVSHAAAGSNFKGTIIGVPQRYTAPRSETVRLLRMRAHADSVSGYLVNADLQFRRRLNDYITFAPSVNCLMNKNRPLYLLAGIEFTGKAWCGYRLWYSWFPLLDETNLSSRQQIMAECTMPLSKKIGLDCSGQLHCRSGGYWSNRLRVSVPVKVNQALTLSPHFMIYETKTGLREKTAGIAQRLQLYKRTFSDITIEQELPFSSWRTIRARGKLSFYF